MVYTESDCDKLSIAVSSGRRRRCPVRDLILGRLSTSSLMRRVNWLVVSQHLHSIRFMIEGKGNRKVGKGSGV